METERRGAASARAERRGAPSAAVAELTAAAPEADPIEPRPTTAHAPWIRPIGDYERRETTIVEGLRYG